MNKNSASGHLLNLTSLEGLYAICVSLGPIYNPSVEAISVENLQQLIEKGHTVQTKLINIESDYKPLVSARQTAFDGMNGYLSSVRNMFQVTCSNPRLHDQFDSIYRKVLGRRATEIEKTDTTQTDPALPEKKHISSSQTGFDDRISNVNRIIILLQEIPDYQPNEEKFTIEKLSQYLQSIVNLHKQVNDIEIQLIQARNNRDYTFYKQGSGIVDIGRRVKKYLRAILNPSNSLYNEISKFNFRLYNKYVMTEIINEGSTPPPN
jgi:hypothetical protein